MEKFIHFQPDNRAFRILDPGQQLEGLLLQHGILPGEKGIQCVLDPVLGIKNAVTAAIGLEHKGKLGLKPELKRPAAFTMAAASAFGFIKKAFAVPDTIDVHAVRPAALGRC